MDDVLKLALGFAIGNVLTQVALTIYVNIRYRLHARKHPRSDDAVSIEELMNRFRQAYVEGGDDGEPAQETRPS